MVERRVSVRLAAVDGDSFKAELANIGREGQRALESISGASAPASAGLGRVDTAAGATLRQLEALAGRAQRAAVSLRAAGASTGTVAERIDLLTGVAGRARRSADDIAAYGASLDRLRARFNPLYAVINRYKATQAEIRQAHRVGAITADEMTAAMRRERQATLASIAAIRGRTTALGQMGMASRFARAQSRQLMYQLVDIGQAIPLAFQSPVYALQNVGFQVAQIGQLYAGQGGVTAAIRDSTRMVGRFLARLGPAAAAVAVLAAGVAAVRYEINKTSDVTVGFGDTALALWQTIAAGARTVAEAIHGVLRPAIEAIAPWVQRAWEANVAINRRIANFLINGMRATFEDIRFLWGNFPEIMSVAVRGAANATIGAMESMINRAIGLLNGLADRVNGVLARIPGIGKEGLIGQIGQVSIGRLENPHARDLAEERARTDARIAAIMASDPFGDFQSAVRDRAVANALARTEEAAEGAGDAIGKASGAMDRLLQQGESLRRSLRTPAEEFAETMENLDKLLRASAISMETYGRAAEQAAGRLREMEEAERRRRLEASSDPIDGAIRALEAYAERADDIADTIERGITRAFQGAEDAVAQFVAKGKFDFASLVTSILADLARLSIRQAVTGPLANALRGALGQGAEGGGGDGGGFLSGIANAIGGLFGGGGGVPGGEYHGGGRVPGGRPVLVPAAALAGAPRYHNGGGPGLAPDEQAAILQRGERVLTRRQNREWEAGGGTQIVIQARDAESFRQSRAQVASDIARAVAFGRRGM